MTKEATVSNDHEQYTAEGYVHIKGFYSDAEVSEIRPIVERFDAAWKQDNATFYQERAINSAYLTGKQYLNSADREALIRFVSSNKLMSLAKVIFASQPAFMNTQLFFNPFNASQKNYWHRDSQYNLSIEEEKNALNGPKAMHFRIALADEPGMEIVPKSHLQWDSSQSLNIRRELNGHQSHENLPKTVTLPLEKGDVLVFSALAIHRGLYGLDRLALDVLFCDPVEELLQFVDTDCLPSEALLVELEDSSAFEATMSCLKRCGKA